MIGKVYQNAKGEYFVIVDEVTKRISGVTHTKFFYSLNNRFNKMPFTHARVNSMNECEAPKLPRYMELWRDNFEVHTN